MPKRYERLYSDVSDERRRVYSAMVTAMDDAVGRIVAALTRYGHANNTLVIFTSDVSCSAQHVMTRQLTVAFHVLLFWMQDC